MKVELKTTGHKEMTNNLNTLAKKDAPNAYYIALSSFINDVEAESTARTPVDTGFLRDSAMGNSVVQQSGRNGASGSISYTAKYAVHVHEKDMPHRVGEAKFLQNAIEAEAPKMVQKIGGRLRGQLIHTTKYNYGRVTQ